MSPTAFQGLGHFRTSTVGILGITRSIAPETAWRPWAERAQNPHDQAGLWSIRPITDGPSSLFQLPFVALLHLSVNLGKTWESSGVPHIGANTQRARVEEPPAPVVEEEAIQCR